MSEQSEQLVLDYLRRAGDAARGTLRADQRLDFLRRLRGRIDEFRESTGASDPEDVRKVLARFGDPAALVRRERERLERERAERAAGGDAAVGGVGGSDERSVTEPIPAVRAGGETRAGAHDVAGSSTRAGTPEDRQPEDTPDRREQEGGQQPASTAGGTGSEGGATGTGSAASARTGGASDASPAERADSTDSTGSAGGATRNDPAAPPMRAAPLSPQARPRHSGPPVYEPRSPKEAGQDLPSAVSRLFDRLPREVQSALRGGVVETIGLVLIGAGGALSPLPLWFIGALVVSFATGWGFADKLAGLLLAPMLAVAGPAVLTMTDYVGGGQPYLAILRSYGWFSFRIGAVLGAIYLVATLLSRVRRRRSQGPPPWRR